MSLNTAHTDGGVLIHAGEMILLHAPNVVLTFTGNEDLKRVGEKSGNAYLTTHRLIFMAKASNGDFKSFSFPFVTLSEVDVEQPVFGANNLRGKVRAQPDGGWKGEAKFKMVFKSGGAIEFATGMMKAIQLAKQTQGFQAAWNAPPPAYFDIMGGAAMPAPPMYYNMPANYYGWAPPAYNFPPPEAGTVFVSEAPPPYPGIGGFGGYPQQPAHAPGYPPPMYTPTAGYPQQPYPNAGYNPQQPHQNPGYNPQQPHQNPGYNPQPSQNPGFNPQPSQNPGYNPQPSQNPGYNPAPPASNPGGANNPSASATGGGGNPPTPGFNIPPTNGYAYANTNGNGQAYVPSAAPPPYAPPPYMNNPQDKKND